MHRRAEQAWRMRWGSILACATAMVTHLQCMRWKGIRCASLVPSRHFILRSKKTTMHSSSTKYSNKFVFLGCKNVPSNYFQCGKVPSQLSNQNWHFITLFFTMFFIHHSSVVINDLLVTFINSTLSTISQLLQRFSSMALVGNMSCSQQTHSIHFS